MTTATPTSATPDAPVSDSPASPPASSPAPTTGTKVKITLDNWKLHYAQVAISYLPQHEDYLAARKVVASILQYDELQRTMSDDDANAVADRFIQLVARNDTQVLEKLAEDWDTVEV